MKMADVISEKEISDEAKSEDERLRKLSGIEELPDFEDLVRMGGVKKLAGVER